MENLGNLDIQKPGVYSKNDLQELIILKSEDREAFDLKLANVLDAFEKFISDRIVVGEYCRNLGEEEVLGISDIFNQCRIDNNLQTA